MNEDYIIDMKGNLPPGTMLQGSKYRIERFIASGGFGCTYEGTHVKLKKRVAIKEFFVQEFCNRDQTNGYVTLDTISRKPLVDRLRAKFVKEAQSLCEFNHPGIVKVNDIFEENGTAYFVMYYIDGCSLNDMVEARGALPEEVALGYIRQVADALREVHSHNRLHLDIKAGNIMVDKYDRAILIDFGASKQYDSEGGKNTTTVLGYTCGFAPPEQMSNSLKNFQECTDLYALGATLYRLVTGETPPDSMTVLSEGGFQIPPGVSLRVAHAIRCAMQPIRHNRPQNVDEFLALLDNEKGREPKKPAPKPAPKPKPEPKKPEPKPEPKPELKPEPEPEAVEATVVYATLDDSYSNPTPPPFSKPESASVVTPPPFSKPEPASVVTPPPVATPDWDPVPYYDPPKQKNGLVLMCAVIISCVITVLVFILVISVPDSSEASDEVVTVDSLTWEEVVPE